MQCFAMCIMAVLAVSCTRTNEYTPEKINGVIWGTMYSITYNGDGIDDADVINNGITDALNEVDAAANAFEPTSELALLNADGKLDNPSQHFIKLLEVSSKIYRESRGAFNPTIGPLVDLWGFGAGQGSINPNDAQVDSALTLVDFEKIEFNSNQVQLAGSGMRLDFAAIAKGYGVDCASEVLRKNGIKDFMVEIGGEVRVQGLSPRGDKWAIQIDAPVMDNSVAHTRLAVLKLQDAAVATSGNYRNYRFDNSGKLVYHTISPVSGHPVETDILSATIVAAEAMTADALATASMVMGLKDASDMIQRLSADKNAGVYGAVFVTESADSESPYIIHTVALHADKATLEE